MILNEKRKESQKKYNLSEKGKIARKKYRLTEKGKIANRKFNAKYQKTEHGKKMTSKNHKKYRDKMKNFLFNLLGNKCVECGLEDMRCLQLDHKNGGGCKEIKKVGGNLNMYLMYYKNPELAKEKLQILCANHNAIKVYTNNEKK